MQRIEITPMKNYETPMVPTLTDARKNPALLKDLPARWKKKAAIFACAGIIGLSALPISAAGTTEELTRIEAAVASANLDIAEIVVHAHHGGSSGVPVYVAYFTEQEAFGFIREKLEAAGLNFDTEPPEISPVDLPSLGGMVRFSADLYDAEKGVIIAQTLDKISAWGSAEYYLNQALKIFSESASEFTVGAFHNSGKQVLNAQQAAELLPPINPDLTWNENIEIRNAFLAEYGENARQDLIDGLDEQIQTFIQELREKGILDKSVIIGDLSGDGRITSADAVLLARYLAGQFDDMEELPLCLKAADINGDGVVNMEDLILLMRMLVGD